MNSFIAYNQGLGRYQPLKRILCYDDFSRGFNGWVDLMPNFTLPDYKARESSVRISVAAGYARVRLTGKLSESLCR